MIFDTSDIQDSFRESVERLCERAMPATQLRHVFDAGTGFDAALWDGLVDLGVPALVVPEKHGGLALSLFDLALVAETLGYHAAPVPFLGHMLASMAIACAPENELQSQYLQSFVTGERRVSLAMDALYCESGVAHPATGKVRADAVLNADCADVLVVRAGEGCGLLAREHIGNMTALNVADRTRPLFAIEYDLADVQLLHIDQAQRARLLDAGRVLLAADAYGGARRCFNMSVAYAKMREQYGAPIGSFQAVKHQLADLAATIDPGIGLYWLAAKSYDDDPANASRLSALAKAHLCEIFRLASRAAVEAHGGIGYTWEYELQIWFKRALFDFAMMGTPGECFAKAGPGEPAKSERR